MFTAFTDDSCIDNENWSATGEQPRNTSIPPDNTYANVGQDDNMTAYYIGGGGVGGGLLVFVSVVGLCVCVRRKKIDKIEKKETADENPDYGSK